MAAVTVNGRTYTFPRRPTVVVCIDGGDPAYFDDGLQRGLVPALQRFEERGFWTTVQAVVPTFTNPNNISIVTGVPRQAAPAARPQAVVLSVPPAGSAACGCLPRCASAGWGLASSKGAEATRGVEKAV